MASISLKEAERRAFGVRFQDGLWDVLIGCWIVMFAVAPLLSRTGLGDFWSTAVFVPFWGLCYLAVYLIRRRVVVPRVGEARPGPSRRRTLTRFASALLVVNVVALALGIWALRTYEPGGWDYGKAFFWLALLLVFTAAGYFLDYPRLYVYGLLVVLSPLVGELLYRNFGVPHHGYPVTFGVTAAVMMLWGGGLFVSLLRQNPLSTDSAVAEEV